LTAESTNEQRAAGLSDLSTEERQQFRDYNAAYWKKFGFPFVICARENKKEAILAAFPRRLAGTDDDEIQAALTEIGKIARLRLFDAVEED
jgi:OHCU decarboxylase